MMLSRRWQSLLLHATWLLPLAYIVIQLLFKDHLRLRNPLDISDVHHALLKKLLSNNHTFVPASHQAFNYVGRWVSSGNNRRKDASFPGAYLTFEVANTTSIYLCLQNTPSQPAEDYGKMLGKRTTSIDTRNDNSHHHPPISLLVTVNDKQAVLFEKVGSGILSISTDLSIGQAHSFTITNLASSHEQGVLEFEGVWIDKGAALTGLGNGLTTRKHTLGEQTTHQQHLKSLQEPRSQIQKLIEVIMPISFSTPKEALVSFPALLAKQLGTFHTILPTGDSCLTTVCSSITIDDLHFRSGAPNTILFDIPNAFDKIPSALILSVGLQDFIRHLSDSPSAHATAHFTSTFTTAYVKLIKSIRAYAYHRRRIVSSHSSLDYDASFTYNSGSSSLPIFLLTPFTPDEQLQRLLSHTISDVVNTLQSNGDRSTYWIDTSGWLQPVDYLAPTAPPDLTTEERNRAIPQLNPHAHAKVADYLSHHLCPFLVSSYEEEKEKCAFNKQNNYLGHLIQPEQEEVGMRLEERKLQLIKESLGLNWDT